MKLFGTAKINEKGNLSIGGVDTIELAKEFKTPLYVMDQELIETTIDKMKEAFQSSRFNKNSLCRESVFDNWDD